MDVCKPRVTAKGNDVGKGKGHGKEKPCGEGPLTTVMDVPGILRGTSMPNPLTMQPPDTRGRLSTILCRA